MKTPTSRLASLLRGRQLPHLTSGWRQSKCTSIGAIRSHYHYHGPGSPDFEDSSHLMNLWRERNFKERGFTVGLGGPVGSGKTATVLALCQELQKQADDINLGVVTNDIFTQEDAEFLVRRQALDAERIQAVETGGCPHAAIREDVSANLMALQELTASVKSPQQPCLLLCESGGDNLAANFSRELADVILYVIDVAGGDKVPRKGGPGITQSDLLIINKIDLAEAVGANLELMESQAQDMRRIRNSPDKYAPLVMASIKEKKGLNEIVDFIMSNYRKAVEVSKEKES